MRITLLSFLSFLLFYQITIASSKCLQDQQSLLLQLKNSLIFESEFSSKLKIWNHSIECCNWSGVTCDNEGHIIGLDLSGEYIDGGFDNSSSLFRLQHLQKLNLAYNNFKSPIPSGFNKLDKLTYLNLSGAGFVGKIPIEISQLTRLVTLDISSSYSKFGSELTLYSQILLKLIQNLQKFVQNLTNIRKLYLDGISISAQGQEWSNALLPLRDLQELSMSYCDLSGALDYSLTRLKNLSVLILDGNNFSSPVPETFANFQYLSALSLSFCGLIGIFPQKIFQIGTMSDIDLSSNDKLQGSFPNYLLSKSFHTIRVSETKFSGVLPNSIGNLKHLSILDLSNCQFNGTLPNSLSNLTKLSYLDLSSNSFTGPLPSFEELQNLVTIYLSNNTINGSIPSFLFTLPLVQSIGLSFNHFSKLEEFTIMSSTSLTDLDLSNNHLSGTFPISIFQLTSLYTLDISSNKLIGSLHLDKLFELRNLSSLYLSYNNLSVDGNVANVDLSSIPNFNFLKLASCNLKFFPSFLINQSSLASLDLSDNKIHGIVPNWIWKLQNLMILNISHNFLTHLEVPMEKFTSKLFIVDIHNNQLHGSIPVFPKSLDYMDYSNNKFSIIPQDIGYYLSSTVFLSLSNNNLQGSIPPSICMASNLKVLDFSFNNIYGTISPCLVTMTSTLEALNLCNNNLNGAIPDMFQSSCNVKTLNFHGNLLHGPIPKSLSHCLSIKVLDIGSNQIVDGFPCFLNNIPTLSVLVLRNNKFHGSLECSYSQENKAWKMIQIMDIAFNNFNGKLPEKYFTWERMMHDENDVVLDFIHSQENSGSYYQDSVTVFNKGQQMELVKILTIFTAMDFSSNNFEGLLPEMLMNFKALHVLNFSNNRLSGEIPSSIGNLKQLESLDLSNNSLVGEIPVQLASLSFLSYLNISFNHLEGKIPTGTQLQSFQASSYEGNSGLYGPPLTKKLDDKDKTLNFHPQPACRGITCSIDWNFLSVELGFVFGVGIVIGPIMFWKQWRISYWKLMDKILCWIFPRMHLGYATKRGKSYTDLRWKWH